MKLLQITMFWVSQLLVYTFMIFGSSNAQLTTVLAKNEIDCGLSCLNSSVCNSYHFVTDGTCTLRNSTQKFDIVAGFESKGTYLVRTEPLTQITETSCNAFIPQTINSSNAAVYAGNGASVSNRTQYCRYVLSSLNGYLINITNLMHSFGNKHCGDYQKLTVKYINETDQENVCFSVDFNQHYMHGLVFETLDILSNNWIVEFERGNNSSATMFVMTSFTLSPTFNETRPDLRRCSHIQTVFQPSTSSPHLSSSNLDQKPATESSNKITFSGGSTSLPLTDNLRTSTVPSTKALYSTCCSSSASGTVIRAVLGSIFGLVLFCFLCFMFYMLVWRRRKANMKVDVLVDNEMTSKIEYPMDDNHTVSQVQAGDK